MKETDTLLDEHPDLVPSFIDMDVRNSMAHRELVSFNSSKKFLGEHPLTKEYISRLAYSKKIDALRQSPEELLKEAANLRQNIKRIECNIRKGKYRDQAELDGWKENLKRANERLGIITKKLK